MGPPSAWDAGDAPADPVDDRHHVRVAVVDAVRNRPEVAADPERLDGYLRDVCPLQPAEVAVVVVAARAGVAEELAQAGAGHHAESTAARVAKRLNSESGIDHGLARWAVDTWAMAVGAPALLPASRPTDAGPAPVTPSAGPEPRPPAPPATTLLPTLAPQPPAPREVGPAEAPALAGAGEDAEVLRAMAVAPMPSPPASEASTPPAAPTVRPADPDPPAPARIDEQLGHTVQRPPRPAPPSAAALPHRTGRRRPLAIGAGAAVAGALVIALVAGLTGGGPDSESGTSPTSDGTVSTDSAVTSATSSTLAPATTVTAAPRSFPTETASLAPGVYATGRFEPSLTATLGDGWKLSFQSPVHLELDRADSDTEIVSFLRSPRPLRRDRIFTSYDDAARTTATEPPPSDLVTWLRGDSRFRVSAATPATKGGVQGLQVDVAVPSSRTVTMCGEGCVPLFQLDGSVFFLAPGSINRIYVLPVLGHELVIVTEAHADRFGAFVEQADRLVDTVAFKG